MMKSIICTLLVVQLLFVVSAFSRDFDFFYFVQQWPGSNCDTQKSCCYPTTGKPTADFGVYGLFPSYDDGTYPSYCDPDSPFDQTRISGLLERMRKEWPSLACPSGDGIAFWTHLWEKFGTCSESVLDQYSYFQTALSLRCQTNLLQALSKAGIKPKGKSYALADIKDAIRQEIGSTPFIDCNVDEIGNTRLSYVYICVDSSGSKVIECPVLPQGKCGSEVEFPTFLSK